MDSEFNEYRSTSIEEIELSAIARYHPKAEDASRMERSEGAVRRGVQYPLRDYR
jgi:hypothetical protein